MGKKALIGNEFPRAAWLKEQFSVQHTQVRAIENAHAKLVAGQGSTRRKIHMLTLADSWTMIGGIIGVVGGGCGVIALFQARRANQIAQRVLDIEVDRDLLRIEYTVVFTPVTPELGDSVLTITVFNRSKVHAITLKAWGWFDGDRYFEAPNLWLTMRQTTLGIPPNRSAELRFPVGENGRAEDNALMGSATLPWVRFEHEAARTIVPLSETDRSALTNFFAWVQSYKANPPPAIKIMTPTWGVPADRD